MNLNATLDVDIVRATREIGCDLASEVDGSFVDSWWAAHVEGSVHVQVQVEVKVNASFQSRV